MKYFKKQKDIIEKYEVSFDEETIKEFKRIVINDCSDIQHYEYDSPYDFCGRNHLKIRNYTSKEVGVQEYNDGPDEIIYHFSYDEYNYPYLVTLIDKLLDSNPSSIDQIFNPTNDRERLTYEQKIKILSKDIDQISNIDIVKKKSKLEELEKLMYVAKLNENQKPVDEYYLKLQKLIDFELIDTISLEEVNRVETFFNTSSKVEKNYQKTLNI